MFFVKKMENFMTKLLWKRFWKDFLTYILWALKNGNDNDYRYITFYRLEGDGNY